MNISINWIKNYIDLTVNSEELIKKLKLHTTDVENIEKVGNGIKNVFVGRIEKITSHPNADKLIVCTTNIGDRNIQIVTGDLSVKEGDVVPIAIDGAVLKDNFKIKKTKLRGELSEGMFCSLEEIGLEEKSPSVFKITDEVKIGSNFIEYFNIEDENISLEVLPNRPDLLSYNGIAKEFEIIEAAKNFRLPEYIKFNNTNAINIKIEDDNCIRYSALIIKNVKIKQSPTWLIHRLASAGIRSINNIVDITNYVLLETGHPIHAFDLDLIENKILVRKAIKGEKVTLLDEKDYEMLGGETLITDGKSIIALGGVMGGELSGINQNTKNLLIEVAYFNPISIRKTSKNHKIQSDSSYRFERGVDPNDSEFVIGRVAKLIQDLANGEIEESYTDIYENKINNNNITLRKSYLKERLEVDLTNEIIENILNKFGFEYNYCKEKNEYNVSIDTKRPDLKTEIDLVEEIGRVYGYYNIESKAPFSKLMEGNLGDFFEFKYEISALFRNNGLHEIRTYSLGNKDKYWLKEGEFKLINPLSKEYEYLRPLTIYGVLESASYNYRNQNRNIKLYEISKTYVKDVNHENGVKEDTTLAFCCIGEESIKDYTDKRDTSFYTFKGILDNIFDELKIDVDYRRENILNLIHSQSGNIYYNDTYIGFLGLLDYEIADKLYDIKNNVYISEINLDTIYKIKSERKKPNKKYDFPAIKREYSFIVPIEIEYKNIHKIFISSSNLIEKINIFDVYRGKGIEEDKTSITISVVYRSSQKTLTDEEVNSIEKNVLSELDKLNVKLRER